MASKKEVIEVYESEPMKRSGSFGWGFLLALLVVVVGHQIENRRPTDDTDGGPDERSGFVLMTDHGTGCQYLASTFMGLFPISATPRLDEEGRHVCVPKYDPENPRKVRGSVVLTWEDPRNEPAD